MLGDVRQETSNACHVEDVLEGVEQDGGLRELRVGRRVLVDVGLCSLKLRAGYVEQSCNEIEIDGAIVLAAGELNGIFSNLEGEHGS